MNCKMNAANLKRADKIVQEMGYMDYASFCRVRPSSAKNLEKFIVETQKDADRRDDLRKSITEMAVNDIRSYSLHELFESYSNADEIFFAAVDNAIDTQIGKVVECFGADFIDNDEYHDFYNECIQETIGNQ